MATKTITALDAIDEVEATDVLPIDTGVQTFKATAAQVLAYVKTDLVDDETIEVDGDDLLSLKDGGITNAKRASLGQVVSSSCGDFNHNGDTAETDVTNLSISITALGTRPIFVGLLSAATDSSTYSYIAVSTTNSGSAIADVLIYRGATLIKYERVRANVETGSGTADPVVGIPVSSIWHIDGSPSAGSNTYTVKVVCFTSATTIVVRHCKLLAYEL